MKPDRNAIVTFDKYPKDTETSKNHVDLSLLSYYNHVICKLMLIYSKRNK